MNKAKMNQMKICYVYSGKSKACLQVKNNVNVQIITNVITCLI